MGEEVAVREPMDATPPAGEQAISDHELPAEKPIPGKQLSLPSYLPRPEAPPGLTRVPSDGPHPIERALSDSSSAIDVSALGKYIRDRGNSFSSAIVKRISSLREADSPAAVPPEVTEFHLSGLKVIVQLKEEKQKMNGGDQLDLKGQISFFSRSNCRDCSAVRSFFRERGLPYVEINVDVFPEREKELVQRTGSAAVPMIFLNEKLLGGLVAMNSLRNSGEFDRRVLKMAGERCPETAPRIPVYGLDDEDGVGGLDSMVGIVRVLRQRVPIRDRITRMKIAKNCFSGGEMVEAIIHHLDSGRKRAIEIGRELAKKHFIHHVFRENDFEDDNHQFYRFLEHDPIIPKCFNFRGSTNDDEPKPASLVGQKLTKLMFAILEAYASNDRHQLDYTRIGASEEFRRYVNLVQDLQRVDIFALTTDEKMAFFLNLYNAMVIHAVIRLGPPGLIDRRAFFSEFHYIIGGYPYSPSTIKNGILRSNRRQPYSLAKPFGTGDKRLELAPPKVNPLIHFGLCDGTRSSPAVRFFSAQGVEAELRFAAREYFLGDGVDVDLEKRTVHLTRIIKWHSADFGQEKDILKWILNYLDANKAGLLTHLLNDGGPVNIVYKNFDWSLNSSSHSSHTTKVLP
ncbi:uncharacterized protein LOC120272372 [Dioscorea cayenensis subsp. rotundata]|uniref:Uncharacterized protein LOC120272372 n=1 Tax=Dioscorea cayennensis subsp. rotundata TaxID=55577 RepID=A0AB40C725_DIOCR|nr:uncharacterized protein LOC120272372 [Dioscorea cayenensis subsp. rotundata]